MLQLVNLSLCEPAAMLQVCSYAAICELSVSGFLHFVKKAFFEWHGYTVPQVTVNNWLSIVAHCHLSFAFISCPLRGAEVIYNLCG